MSQLEDTQRERDEWKDISWGYARTLDHLTAILREELGEEYDPATSEPLKMARQLGQLLDTAKERIFVLESRERTHDKMIAKAHRRILALELAQILGQPVGGPVQCQNTVDHGPNPFGKTNPFR